jgi:hypothetical protein
MTAPRKPTTSLIVCSPKAVDSPVIKDLPHLKSLYLHSKGALPARMKAGAEGVLGS